MNTEPELTDWIQKNALLIFGEELEWYTLPNFNADLLGTDKNGNPVIIEVKKWTDSSANRNIQEYVSIGQILHYANSFQKQQPNADIRLFIIADYLSEKVEASCEYLRLHGFNIQHLSWAEARAARLQARIDALEKKSQDKRK